MMINVTPPYRLPISETPTPRDVGHTSKLKVQNKKQVFSVLQNWVHCTITGIYQWRLDKRVPKFGNMKKECEIDEFIKTSLTIKELFSFLSKNALLLHTYIHNLNKPVTWECFICFLCYTNITLHVFKNIYCPGADVSMQMDETAQMHWFLWLTSS